MPVSKPTSLPRWATDGSALLTEPSSGKKDVGWEVEEPPADWMNWLQNLVYQWLHYLDDLEAQALTWTAEHVFDDDVTVNGELTVNNAAGIGASLTVGGNLNVSGDVGIAGITSLVGAVGVSGAANFGSTVGVVGVLTTVGGVVVPTGSYVDVQGTASIKVASNPAANSGTANIFNNRLHGKNVPKSWAKLTLSHTLGAIVDNGFNVDSANITSPGGGVFSDITVNFKQAMANANYAVKFGAFITGSNTYPYPCILSQGTSSFTFRVMALQFGGDPVLMDFAGSDAVVTFHVDGEQ